MSAGVMKKQRKMLANGLERKQGDFREQDCE